MSTAYRHRTVPTFSALVVAALGLTFAVPFSATLGGWALEVPMRLSFAESLLATLGVFAAWFVVSRLIDVILEDSDLGGTHTGRAVSTVATLVLLGGGYFLIVDSFLVSLIMALGVCAAQMVLRALIAHIPRASRRGTSA